VIDWLVAAVPIFKAAHILGLIVWCGGLMALPLILARHEAPISAEDYRMIRRASHLVYTLCVTPAAVLTVIAGTWLIFLREVFTPWLYAKLFVVTLLVCAHAWIGHILAKVGEEPEERTPPAPYLPVAAVMAPALAWMSFPAWLTEPRGHRLPLDVPSW
jgi:protoporphyrinogen IX oxidase